MCSRPPGSRAVASIRRDPSDACSGTQAGNIHSPRSRRIRTMRPRLPLRTMIPLLVCHSHLRWDWVYQRPQHLLSRLARRWPVIVEEEPIFDDRPPGLDILRVTDGVTVLRPHRRPGQDFDLGGLVEEYVALARGGRP